MTFFSEVRGTEIKVHAEKFFSDFSVGIGYGPDELWAETLDGQPFELTDDEVERLGNEAAEIAWDDMWEPEHGDFR